VNGVLRLALAHALRRWGRSLVVASCVAVTLAIPLAGRVLVARFAEDLRARAATTPLVVGAKGSRFDLVFSSVYFQPSDIGTVPLGAVAPLRERAMVIPLHIRFTARGYPIIATTLGYSELRGLRVERGDRIALMGEAALGSRVARELGLGPGDTIYSDARSTYRITGAPPVELSIVGVYAPTGGPEDGVIFVDLETAWVLEGIAHGHDDASTIVNPNLLLGRMEGRAVLSGAVAPYQRITPENIDSFHIHGDRDELPLTAMLVYPHDDRQRTIIIDDENRTPARQAVEPPVVIERLMERVVRVRTLLDGVSLVLGATTLLLLALIVVLTRRVREAEIEMLKEIGAGRATIAKLLGYEYAIILVTGLLIALLLVLGASIGLDGLWMML